MDKELSIILANDRSSSDDEVSFADTVFGFWEDFQDPPENSSNSGDDEELDDDDEDESSCSVEKNKAFWEEQNQLLKV